jgi:GT2 family glycosyltransferase
VSEELPSEVSALLRERASARAERDWVAADGLRERMRELGWEPIDSPSGSTARPVPATAPTEPSLLEQPASVPASLVVVLDDHPADLQRFVAGLQAHPQGADHELVVVANAASGAESLPPAGDRVRLLSAEQRLGWADAANLGLRGAGGAVVILLDTSVEPAGDFVGPLLAAFDDARVGVAGPWGVTSRDGREFDEAPPGEVDAIEGYCLAIRRQALQQVGGFDHRFRYYRNADLDLSFAIRANGWHAMRTPPLPLVRHEHRGWTAHPAAERDRLSRRNFYRFLKHWGDRRDLLLNPGSRPGHHG